MNILKQRIDDGVSNLGKRIHKHNQYAGIYNEFLAPYVGKKITLAEIGIGYGGCLQTFQEFLGPEAMIFGIDSNDTEDLRGIQNDKLKLIVGNQGDLNFLKGLPAQIGRPEVIIDDGSHFSKHQIDTFEALFPCLADGGLYFVEDTHTSYRETHDGGYKLPGAWIEYCKGIIDALHYQESERILVDNPTLKNLHGSIEYIHFYWTMTVIKKHPKP